MPYISSSYLRYSLLWANSFNFIMGCVILTQGVIYCIGAEGIPAPYEHYTKSPKKPSGLPVDEALDRFPSIGSGGVLVFVALLVMGVSGLGVTAMQLNHLPMLDTFAYVSFISCFIKFLLILATAQMHAFNYTYDPITLGPVLAIVVSVIEIILGMMGCHLAKLWKRGDPGEPDLLPFPGKDNL